MTHIDLFSGIGGFAYAIDQVWDNVEHIFCDNDKFCQQVLKKHWPNSKIYGDIRKFITDAFTKRLERIRQSEKRPEDIKILTGGFPCQPFSQAGQRRGTEDDRYLWPEMLKVIQLASSEWVVAENVFGLVNWNGGMVLEQVCSDLEVLGYEVQPFIIPACAVNAPHRRDRVWIIAKNSISKRRNRGNEDKRQVLERQSTETENERPDWERNWVEVATELCGVDDGISEGLDFAGWTKAQHRVQRLKALGNAIVPQTAVEIMKVIKIIETVN